MQNQDAVMTSRVHSFVAGAVNPDLHDKRVLSLANAAIGLLNSASLTIHDMGRGLARAKGLHPKHATKQIDRLLSNPGIVIDEFFAYWVPFIVAARQSIMVILDWTDFDGDNQCTLALNTVTRHGRATPLMWITVGKDTLKGNQKEYEQNLLTQFRTLLPEGVHVTIIADRGFSDIGIQETMNQLGFKYIVRLRKNIIVTMPDGSERRTEDMVATNGRSMNFEGCRITAASFPVKLVVTVKKAGMKEAWILATNDGNLSATACIAAYARRFSIEENFRDTKDIRFGAGLSWTRIDSAERRDRLLLVNALAVALLTFLGAAGETTNLYRYFKVNTSTKRQHSLYKQGIMYLEALPTLRREYAVPLLEEFDRNLRSCATMADILGAI